MTDPKTLAGKRNWRGLVFALIPLGFLALVAAMVLVGEETTGPANDIGEMNPAEESLQTSPSPMETEPVADTEVEINPVEGEPRDLYDNPETPFTPTPSGPEGKDNEVIISE
ncbi:hypothetical protein [Anianabacter salinae]|uniref:hypothetical protein n=1 Tax=Anianabacter salinae TaxID=2851023 RepID=UPI00225E0C39|nr:hypothetical protein [Anianabacter salinae]MBV0913069.1 hypothetical protein [Anianabacter salinae]